MSSVGEDFPKEQARVRRVLGYFKECGPAGAFGAAMIEQTLANADRAMASGDIIAIIPAYKDLKDIKE